MQIKCTVPQSLSDRKRQFFNLRKGTEILTKGIWSALLSAAYQNGDQYNDIVPFALHQAM